MNIFTRFRMMILLAFCLAAPADAAPNYNRMLDIMTHRTGGKETKKTKQLKDMLKTHELKLAETPGQNPEPEDLISSIEEALSLFNDEKALDFNELSLTTEQLPLIFESIKNISTEVEILNFSENNIKEFPAEYLKPIMDPNSKTGLIRINRYN